MSSQQSSSFSGRQARALQKFEEGHQTLKQSLEGLDAEDAFLGSRWSVWEVLKHLDSENFVDALENIVSGDAEMLPPFTTREDQLKKDLEHLDETHNRLKKLIEGLTEEQLSKPVTPPNPNNSFPGLTMLELFERVSGHAATHSRQIDETRKYVQAFQSRERAVHVIGLANGDTSQISTQAKDLLSYADYIAGSPEALDVVRPLTRGVELTLRQDNQDEVLSRLGRDARAGIWAVVCCMGDPNADGNPVVDRLKKHADKVVVHG